MEKFVVPKGKTLEDVISSVPAPFREDEPAETEEEIEVEYE